MRSLCLVLVVGFVYGPERIAWASEQLAASRAAKQEVRLLAGSAEVLDRGEAARDPARLSRRSRTNVPVDENGNRKTVTAPSGTTSYTFDALDRMETVTSSGGQVSRYTYDEVGNRKTLSYPNGVVTTYNYDALNRLYNLSNVRGAAVISSYTYALGPAGNRTGVTEQGGRVVGYNYDDDYRLVDEVVMDPGVTNPLVFHYVYDAAGNRKSKTTMKPDLTQEVTSYHYDDNDRLNDEQAPSGATTYSYDDDGSTTKVVAAGQTKVFTWTPERRLASATITGTAGAQVTFEYDEDGIRVRKVKNGVGTRYVIDQVRAFQQVVEERDTGSGALAVSYTYGDDLIAQDRGGTRRFYETDGQLSTRQLTDESGGVTDSYTYEAFGVLVASSGSTENAYRYTGQQEDADVGGYYLRARYYNAAAGRFLNEDFVDRDGLSYHKYLYTRNNPANWRAPSGHETLLEVVVTTAIIGAVVGALVLGGLEAYREGTVFSLGVLEHALLGAGVGAVVGAIIGVVAFYAGAGSLITGLRTALVRGARAFFGKVMEQHWKTAVAMIAGFVVGTAFGFFTPDKVWAKVTSTDAGVLVLSVLTNILVRALFSTQGRAAIRATLGTAAGQVFYAYFQGTAFVTFGFIVGFSAGLELGRFIREVSLSQDQMTRLDNVMLPYFPFGG